MDAKRGTGGGGARQRDTALGVVAVAALSLTLSAGTAWSTGASLSTLGVLFDAHLYTDIARSFPLPYPPEARAYAGQAPGYPAAIALARFVLPRAWLNWAEVSLLVSWLAAAGAAVAFYFVCRASGLSPFWPAALFATANPRWVSTAASAHAEPLAMFFAVAALLAYVRDRPGWSMGWVSLAALCRFPALLLAAPLAYGFVVSRGRRDARTLALLALPALALALLHTYLALRIPGFQSVWHSHGIFWSAEPVLPFSEWLRSAATLEWPGPLPLRALTYGTLAFYVAAIVFGFRPGERDRFVLPLWVAVIVVFHASLGGVTGIRAFPRLALLAWPAALLVLWRLLAQRVPVVLAALLVAATAALSSGFASQFISDVAVIQPRGQEPVRDALERVESDVPGWLAGANHPDIQAPPGPPARRE